jgi:hypothetical protein
MSSERVLKITPFYQDRFCYFTVGDRARELLPRCLSESEECIFEYIGDLYPEDAILYLQNLGFQLKQDSEFFNI